MKVHSVGATPGQELSIYLPKAIDLMHSIEETFQPSQASAAVAANEVGAGKVFEIVEKRLEMDLWQLECTDEDSGQKDLMLWGEVKHKVAKLNSWRPRTHQLFLHVGARQQSAPRVVRSCGYLESGCSQLRIPMSIGDAPRKATNCPQERRGGSEFMRFQAL